MLKFTLFVIIIGWALAGEIIEYATTKQSCAGRCDVDFVYANETDEESMCVCTASCVSTNNCCSDYFKECLKNEYVKKNWPSCEGKCENEFNETELPCQCGPFCIEDDNCCPDYYDLCLQDAVTNEEIEDIAESLLFWDDNNLASQLTINYGLYGGRKCDTPTDKPFLSLNSTASAATYKRLAALYNDYFPDMTRNETMELQETKDQDQFIAEVCGTKLMRAIRKFLVEKKFVADDKFIPTITRIWFEQYDRPPYAAFGSSGFENVFLGETDGTATVGFHNWFYFLNQYNEKKIEYDGYIDYAVYNEKAIVASIRFKWNDKCNENSEMFIGTSPEFEIALYTLCWFTRPNTGCSVLLGGKKLHIHTTDVISLSGRRLVDTAYPYIIGLAVGNYSHLSSTLQAFLLFLVIFVTHFKY